MPYMLYMANKAAVPSAWYRPIPIPIPIPTPIRAWTLGNSMPYA